MDYALPHALDVPPVETFYHEVRATTNPLGLRGLGECGNPGLGAAIANAVCDALRETGVGLTKLPVTPALVWEATRGARRNRARPSTRIGTPRSGRHAIPVPQACACHGDVDVIAEVVFDLPRPSPSRTRFRAGMGLQPGQRVSAPLHGRARIGVVVALSDRDAPGLKPIERPVDHVPVLSPAALALGRWAADESLSSWGSALLAFLPPPAGPRADVVAPPPPSHPTSPSSVEVWVGATRERRLVEHLRNASGSALVITPDRDGAARWAGRLDATRLDSGATDSVRRAAWFAAARGRARIVVGTRSALLTPVPPPATLVLLDEHEPAHKPPGPPRIHSRDLLRQRAALEGSRLLLVSGTPSVESWWRAETQHTIRDDAEPTRGPRSSPPIPAAS